MLFELSNLNPNLALTLGYLNPALKNSTLKFFFFPAALSQSLQLVTNCVKLT